VFPIYHQPEIQHVIINAVKWAAPVQFPQEHYGNLPPVVEVHGKLEHSIAGLHEKKD
jgi:trehalose utilization protein